MKNRFILVSHNQIMGQNFMQSLKVYGSSVPLEATEDLVVKDEEIKKAGVYLLTSASLISTGAMGTLSPAIFGHFITISTNSYNKWLSTFEFWLDV